MPPRRCRKAVSERKPPLQFCESPVHIRHKQSTPVHGCINPITADVVPIEEVLNEWVSPQFERQLTTVARTARRAGPRTNNVLTSTLCSTAMTTQRRPIPDHRFKPLRFVLDSPTNNENEPPLPLRDKGRGRGAVVVHERTSKQCATVRGRSAHLLTCIIPVVNVNRESFNVNTSECVEAHDEVDGSKSKDREVLVDVHLNHQRVESFHNDSSLDAGHKGQTLVDAAASSLAVDHSGARRHTLVSAADHNGARRHILVSAAPEQQHVLSSSVDRLTGRTLYAQGSLSLCDGGFNVNTPVLDQCSLSQRRPLGLILNSYIENTADGDCNTANNALSNSVTKTNEEPCRDDSIDSARRSKDTRRRLRSHSSAELRDRPRVDRLMSPPYWTIFDSLFCTQPLRSPRQHGPVLVCDTPSSHYGLSYRSRQLQCFTENYKPARRSVLINIAS